MFDSIKKQIRAARRKIAADVVLKNGRLLNVFTGRIQKKDVAVCEGIIVGVGDDYYGENERDLNGGIIAPGLIDGHLHIESSMMTPVNLAEALLVRGTTTVVADPHEIANVWGMAGIWYMIKESESIPFDFFFMAPSCVPATPLETSGAILTAADLRVLKDHPRVLGLAEVMNFPGVIMEDEQVLEKLILFRDRILDGHCPGLTSYDLQAYLTAGIRSDHETTEPAEAIEKLESGMMIMIREGSRAKNLSALLPLVHDKNLSRFCIVSDDLHPEDILLKGHMDHRLRKAVKLGLDPVSAVQMVTRNPSEYFGLKDRGAVAPGFVADMVVFDDLESFNIVAVYKNGRQMVTAGTSTGFPKPQTSSANASGVLNMAPLKPEDLKLVHSGGKARVMEIIPDQILTRQTYETVPSENGLVKSSVGSDILKLCVIERHQASGRIGLGLVRGFGIKRGALASSVAHDSHNVIAVGVTDEEIVLAVESVRLMGGGLAVVSEDRVLAEVPLEIAGLMSTLPLKKLCNQLAGIRKAAAELECRVEEPFMILSFLSLPVIPELKLTDRGLVDASRFEFVPLFSADEKRPNDRAR